MREMSWSSKVQDFGVTGGYMGLRVTTVERDIKVEIVGAATYKGKNVL